MVKNEKDKQQYTNKRKLKTEQHEPHQKQG